MLKSRVRVIHAFLAGVACLAAAPEPEQAPSALLERLGRVSLLYTDTVLRFSCDETLRSSPGGTFKDSYIYVFGEDGRFHDYRTRRGSKNGAEIPPDKVPTRRYLTQALSWVFQFHPARHGRIAFTFMGEDTALGLPAVVVAFEPVPPIEKGVNEWHGTAWIDPRTAQLLKVEALLDIDDTIDRWYEAARSSPIVETVRFTWSTVRTEFGILAHGLRFPSFAVIETQTHTLSRDAPEKVVTNYRVAQIYENYRFFSVRSEDEVQRLTGTGPPEP
jgi:hypothetical protein